MDQAAKTIVVGHKIINLEELYTISTYDSMTSGQRIEVAVDSPLYSELNKAKSKENALVRDYQQFDEAKGLRKVEARAILVVKLIQLIKLKSTANKDLVDCLVSMLNNDEFEGDSIDFFQFLYDQLERSQVFPIEKERYILNSLPCCFLAKQALLAYMCRDGISFLNAILALSLETVEFPAEYFNEYSLTLRGRATQGVIQFKNQMLALVADSKKRQQKSELTDVQKEFKISKVFNGHTQLADKSAQLCIQLQNEINSELANIFQNKKYKDILKLAIEQQKESVDNMKEQYDMRPLVNQLKELSVKRQKQMGNPNADELPDLYDIYVQEILLTFKQNKEVEDKMKEAAKGNQEEEAAQKDDKKKAKKKKGKDAPKSIQFGKGTRIFFDFLLQLYQDCQSDDQVFCQKLNYFENKELQMIVQEIADTATETTRRPKCPKGTRDMSPRKMAIREKAFETIRSIFKKHGAVEIDTPVFELKETLTSKYGEDSKLIYDLEDQGGELLSLRYDLTVPFARYVALKGISSIKRFHIGKVYRRDQPQMNKGRFREFYQCDFDIAGSYGVMIPDADLLSVIIDILSSLNIGSFMIKLNHRKFLDAMIQLSGCESRKFKAICSSIDKLDKEPWENVRSELIHQKGLTTQMCAKLEKFVQYKGEPWAMLKQLKDQEVFKGNENGEKTIGEMEILFTYLESIGVLDKIQFDFSLARGLDYYTGLIYEAVLTDTNRVGSISGGGRYDGLIGMFSGKNIPSVGGSIGIERIFNILEEIETDVRPVETQILVSSLGKNLTAKRLETCSMMWKAGIKAETLYTDNPRADKTFSSAFDNGIPLILIIGEQEIQQGIYKVRSLNENKEYEFTKDKLLDGVKDLIAKNPKLIQQEQKKEEQIKS